MGFRPAATALSIVWDWLGIKADIPSFDVIRVWACRVGVAQLQFSIEGDDWIWLVDHSNQIGQERVLQIIGIRVRDLPPLGETLPLEKVRVLATISETSWTRDDVRREYKTLAERIGPPKYLLTDGAVELRESADVLEIKGENAVGQLDQTSLRLDLVEAPTLRILLGETRHHRPLGRAPNAMATDSSYPSFLGRPERLHPTHYRPAAQQRLPIPLPRHASAAQKTVY